MATEKKTEEMVDIETADLDTVAEEVTTTDTIEEPETNVAEDTAEEPAEEITEESVEAPAEETADKPAEKTEEEPVAETAETAEEEPAAETAEEVPEAEAVDDVEEIPEAEPVVDESTTVPPTNVDVPDMVQRNNVPVYQTPASAAPFTYVSGTFKVLGPVINGRVRVAFNIGGIGRTNGFAETKYFNF